MSYILDALKRAERDRHLARVPTLATVHVSARQGRPLWPWVAVGVLLVNAIVVTLLLRASPVAGPPGTISPALPAVVAPAADVQRSARPTATESHLATEPRASRSVADASARPGPDASAPPQFAREQSAQPTAPPPAPAPSDAPAPRSAPTAAQSPVAALRLEMLVNAEDPAERAVYINGRRYVTGQSLESGAIIESIAQDAVVLRWAGQRYLLRWQQPPAPLGR